MSASSNAILAQCKFPKLKQGLQVLSSLHSLPQPSFFSSLLQLCIDYNADREGRFLHRHLLHSPHASHMHLNTKFIIFYAKVGDLDAARRVFDGMHQRTVVSWTALMSGYSQNGYPGKALEVFLGMRRSGLKANQFGYGSALRACTRLLSIDSGTQMQACIEKSRFSGDMFVLSALVDLHSKCGAIDDAVSVFGKMEQRDVVCWNALIGGYASQEMGHCAFRMFHWMLREGMMPDHFTLGNVLKGCSGVTALRKVIQIHGLISHLGFGSHRIVIGSLLDAYRKCKSLHSARILYDSMLEKDLISGTALITGYAQEEIHCDDAMELFSRMNQMGFQMDGIIMCSMLSICANLSSLSLGQQIHAHAFKNRPDHDVAMGNALIDMYAKSGEIDDAVRVFDGMQEKNVISWTSLIAGYGKHGHGKEAIALFKKMEAKDLKPNDVTFLALLFACSHTGLTDEGWQCFNTMVSKYKIHPRAEHYSCIVDLLARGGLLKEAYDLVCEMKGKPNASHWGALLGACRIYDNTSLGEISAAHLFNLDPRNPVNYVVLANIYNSAGLWRDAWKARKLIEGKHIMKEPGSSFIHSTTKMPALLPSERSQHIQILSD